MTPVVMYCSDLMELALDSETEEVEIYPCIRSTLGYSLKLICGSRTLTEIVHVVVEWVLTVDI